MTDDVYTKGDIRPVQYSRWQNIRVNICPVHILHETAKQTMVQLPFSLEDCTRGSLFMEKI